MSELVNGIMDVYSHNKVDRKKVTYNSRVFWEGQFERILWQSYEEIKRNFDNPFSEKLTESLEQLIESYVVDPGGPRAIMGDPYNAVRAYSHLRNPFGGGILDAYAGAVCRLRESVVLQAEQNFLPYYSEEDQRGIIAIATAMEPYIVEDDAYLKKHCVWY